jgi:hypothetical protein
MHIEGFTHHAQSRLQQRGIPTVVVDYLEEFGTIVRCNGADRAIFDKAAQKRLRRHLGGQRGLDHFEKWMDVYAVYSDGGDIITVAHQTKRHHRN